MTVRVKQLEWFFDSGDWLGDSGVVAVYHPAPVPLPAARMLRETGNIKLVSRLLGHSSIETTSRYGHVLDDDLERAMDAFSGLSPAVSPAGRKIIE